jgi:hypothetical protein
MSSDEIMLHGIQKVRGFESPFISSADGMPSGVRGAPDIDIRRFPRRSVTASFHRSLVAGDDCRVRLSVKRIGDSSIVYCWRVLGRTGCCVASRPIMNPAIG